MSEHEQPDSAGIELPKPTAAPMVVALGITMLFAGLVTNALVSIVGLPLVLLGGIGWWRGVLPDPQEILSPLQSASERAPAIRPAPERVAHLIAGEDLHRVRVPAEIHPFSAGLAGGAAGGVAMALVALLYGATQAGSLWLPINLLASIVLPSLDSADPAQLASFQATALLTALAIHAALSLMVGAIFAALLPMFPRHPVLVAGITAPLIWSSVAWASIGIVAPALEAHIQWGWFVASQLAFGLTAGWVVSRSERIATLQTWPLAARMGLEATGLAPADRRPQDTDSGDQG